MQTKHAVHVAVYTVMSRVSYACIAVFTVAEFYMEYQLVYSVPTCDYQLFNLKQQQLHEFICRKSVEKCPFHTTASCHHFTKNVRCRQTAGAGGFSLV